MQHRRILRQRVALRAYMSVGTKRSIRTIPRLYLLALSTLAAGTTTVGEVVGVHDGDTLTLRTEDNRGNGSYLSPYGSAGVVDASSSILPNSSSSGSDSGGSSPICPR